MYSAARDGETAVKASLLKASCMQSDFVAALYTLSHFLSLTHSLSVSFQTVNIDLFDAAASVDTLLAVIYDKRLHADECFAAIWKECTDL